MKYSFNLDNTFDEIEDFEEKSDNICTVKVYSDNFKLIENCRVELFLSKNGMIGLGKELIRMAQNFHVGRHVHLDPPSDKDDVVEKLGIFFTPASVPTIILSDESRTIDSFFYNPENK